MPLVQARLSMFMPIDATAFAFFCFHFFISVCLEHNISYILQMSAVCRFPTSRTQITLTSSTFESVSLPVPYESYTAYPDVEHVRERKSAGSLRVVHRLP